MYDILEDFINIEISFPKNGKSYDYEQEIFIDSEISDKNGADMNNTYNDMVSDEDNEDIDITKGVPVNVTEEHCSQVHHRKSETPLKMIPETKCKVNKSDRNIWFCCLQFLNKN